MPLMVHKACNGPLHFFTFSPFCVLLVLLSLVLSGCGRVLDPEPEPFEVLPRESKIPDDAEKVVPDSDSFLPILLSEEFEYPVPMEGPVNTAGGEDSAFITPDGQNFYFFFTPAVNIPAENQLHDGVTGIYWSQKRSGVWTEPERVVLNDDVSLDGCEFVRGGTMWFCSVRTGNLREIDFYTAELREGEWSNWQNAGERLNLEIGIGEMHLSAAGTELFFHADKPGGTGGLDIWLTVKKDGQWQDATPVEPVNTSFDEGWPFLTEDGRQLWFTRFYQGAPAIYRSINNGIDWQEPELIVYQFAAEPSLDLAGNLYFTHHFFRDGQMVEADIYVARPK